MEPNPLDVVAALFAEALPLDAAARERLLEERCGGDAAMRGEVLSLLAASEGGGDRLEHPPMLSIAAASRSRADSDGDRSTEDAIPERIGQYRVISVLGEGGMGVVYLAEAERPRRRVALKVIRVAAQSRSAIRRFEQEAQVLAMLRHPGIAQVYETGSADAGRGQQPFIAMELVEGLPLNAFATERKLETRARLELVARVCDAVQHAHDRGVIHRDLKPGNILVQAEEPGSTGTATLRGIQGGIAQPKILDFGVARIADSDTGLTHLVTGAGQLIGTLAYMSPEQVGGTSGGAAPAIDARTDVYALGVILYELLTGRPPLDVRSLSVPEAVRVIKEDEPSRLSASDRTLRGDVETIVAKALAKDPQLRYASAAELAGDLRRFLGDEPIEARPPSTLYQAMKFARRHRGLVAGVAAAMLILVASTIVLALVAKEAIRQRDAADNAKVIAAAEASASKKVNLFFSMLLLQSYPGQAQGKQFTIAEAATRVEGLIEKSFPDEPKVRASLHSTIGRVFEGQGEYDKALRHFAVSYDLYRDTLGDEAIETLQARLASATLERPGVSAEATIKSLEEGLAIAERALGPANSLTCDYLAALAVRHAAGGRLAEAERLCRLDMERRAPATGATPTGEQRRSESGLTLITVLVQLDRAEEALAMAERVVPEIVARRGAADPVSIRALSAGGRSRAAARNSSGAEEWFRAGYEAAQTTYGKDHPSTLALADSVAGACAQQGKFDEAEKLCRETLAAQRARLGEDDRATIASMNNLGWLLSRSGRHAEAVPVLRDAVAAMQRTQGPENPATLNAVNNLASALVSLGQFEECAELERAIIASADKVLPAGHSERARYRYVLGKALMGLGKHQEAIGLLTTCHETIKGRAREKNMERQSAEALAEAFTAIGNADEAAKWSRAAEAAKN